MGRPDIETLRRGWLRGTWNSRGRRGWGRGLEDEVIDQTVGVQARLEDLGIGLLVLRDNKDLKVRTTCVTGNA
jgi:hypothetical protein